MKHLLFLLGFFVLMALVLSRDAAVELGPGVLAPQTPLQTDLEDAPAYDFKGYTITPLAAFEIRAKVLSKEHYRFDREADLSPMDLALGWGRMSDESVLKDIEISQSNRWYYWQVQQFPVPRKEIESSSANMHIIPGDEQTLSVLEDIRRGDIVTLKGSLVRVDGDDGWYWQSSLTRTDTGARACEVFVVDAARIGIF